MLGSIKCREMLKPLRRGDKLTACVIPDNFSRLGYRVEVHCSRRVWRDWYSRSGKSEVWFIGRSKTREAAAKKADSVIAKLIRIREQMQMEPKGEGD